ncbi:unannotated protein [freshwater metagenome]|uniref:Unannotated protein n=1 Tax=freshwater metagenome TaxID=449393 RepID=A0A6J7GLV0_9ZZZZ
MALQVVQRDIRAEVNIAEEAYTARIQYFAQGGDDAFDAGMVGGNTVANESVSGWQPLKQIDRHVDVSFRLQNNVSGIDAGRTGTNDRKAKF